MAPSGEHRPEALGAAQVHAAAIAASNAAAALRAEVGRLRTNGAGKTVAKSCEEATARAGAAERLFAALAATAKALRIREDAAKAWNKNAPKDHEIEEARKAVVDAQQKLRDASAASGDTSAASKELEAAQKRLKELKDKRKAADEAYDKAEKRADLELAKIAPQDISDDAPGTGTPAPGTTSPGTGAPSAGTGRPSGQNGVRTDPSKTPGGTPKPSSTPSATPAATKPTETSSGDDLSGLLTQLAAQQQQPAAQAQAQPATATPTAATPQMPQSSQPTQDKKSTGTNPLDKILGSDGVFGLDDATRALGTPAVALGGGSAPTTSSPSTPATAVTPSAPAASAPSTTGLSASATANQQPVTSGASATNLNTSTDVSGRPAEQQRGAFSPGPETKASSATGTSSAAAPAHAAGARPGAAGMPMVPMGGMAPVGGAGGKGDRDRELTTSASGSEESYYLHGRQAVDAAVPGGTIAQRDHPRRRPDEDAA